MFFFPTQFCDVASKRVESSIKKKIDPKPKFGYKLDRKVKK
jgi:hypothetical protein